VVAFGSCAQKAHIAVIDLTRNCMLLRSAVACFATLLLATLAALPVRAQDVPGIEICTVEKTMERRTSCLQSNVDFLQKTITKLTLDHQQKLDAANRQIDALKTTVAGLQKTFGDLQAALTKLAEDLKKKQDAPPPKDK
jgi:prophage DNA circulation protein